MTKKYRALAMENRKFDSFISTVAVWKGNARKLKESEEGTIMKCSNCAIKNLFLIISKYDQWRYSGDISMPEEIKNQGK
jgi:hypothetical protein